MRNFLDDDFLLGSATAKKLYKDNAAGAPIYDYHSHLIPAEIAEDRQFETITRIWLDGDHYKWRAMRTAGVDEKFITGDADDRSKFLAWAETVPQCIGNPLYHWTHLELRRYFGFDELLNPATAEKAWAHCNERLREPALSARGILKSMNVRMLATTDDPVDGLEHHARMAAEPDFDIDVLPTWRPDAALKIDQPGFNDYLAALGKVHGSPIRRFDDLLAALGARLEHFAAHGCLASDHGIDILRFDDPPDTAALDAILTRRLKGETPGEQDITGWYSALLVWLGREYAQRGWVMQLHLGAQRDNNTRMLERLGPNTGYDSIGDRSFAEPLARLLDALDRDDQLPRSILYCLNPRDNEVLATMTGNFQGGGIAGKMQFGSGWWFNDQKDGIERQLTSLAQMGLLSKFVGMLTDSRSLLSFPRHEYFRRILCNLVGGWVENGEAPADFELLGRMIADVCSTNAARYFGLDSASSRA